MAQIQYKVNQLAKDLNIKTKDIVDMMSDAGIEVKTQKSLEPDEFGVFFNLITQANQINDIDRYLDGETYIPTKAKAEVEDSETESAVRSHSSFTTSSQDSRRARSKIRSDGSTSWSFSNKKKRPSGRFFLLLFRSNSV